MKFVTIATGLLCCTGCLARVTEIGTWDAGSGGGASAGGGGGGTANGGGSNAGGGTGTGGGVDTKVVATTDVSILYPLTADGGSTDYLSAGEAGSFGALLPEDIFTTATGGSVDHATVHPSGFATLRAVSLRLDPCSKRVAGVACTPELRLVFQALYEKAAGEDGDPVAGTAATDGAVHVIYDVPDSELVSMLQEILALRHANGDGMADLLGPHPILVAQGLGGAFAQGLRATILAHAGRDRIARVTVFNHIDPEFQGWQFSVFDRASDGGVAAGTIPEVEAQSVLVTGSDSTSPNMMDTYAGENTSAVVSDPVEALLSGNRPDAGTLAATTALEPVYEAALRVQNPTVHNVSNTDCANCHMAEGAQQTGQRLYGFTPVSAFTNSRSLEHVDQRTSVTNFHAFGYLFRQVSIMSRTANESVAAAEAFEAKLPPQ